MIRAPGMRLMLTVPLALSISMISLVQSAVAKPCEPVGSAAVAKQFSQNDEDEYSKRFAALMESMRTQTGLASYDPVVDVAGVPDAGLPVMKSPDKAFSLEALQAAEAYAGRTNSSSLVIWYKGKIVLERYFGAAKANDLVNARSFAKPLTAIAIGRALQLGMIKSLDQPVADFVPAWRQDSCKARILIRHLLDMRTGFLPQAAAMDPQHILNRAYLHPRHDEIIVHDYPLVSEPGTRYDYSNATSEMVAPVIEAASGMKYQDFIATQVIQKIRGRGGKIWLNRIGGTAHSGCCILLPTSDWLRLSLLLLKDGKWGRRQLLPKGYVAEMRSATVQNPYYGMGVWIAGRYVAERGYANPDRGEYTILHSEPYAASDLYLFDGNANQVSYIIPSEDMIILRTGVAPPKTERWDNSKLPNLVLNGLRKPNPDRVPQALAK